MPFSRVHLRCVAVAGRRRWTTATRPPAGWASASSRSIRTGSRRPSEGGRDRHRVAGAGEVVLAGAPRLVVQDELEGERARTRPAGRCVQRVARDADEQAFPCPSDRPAPPPRTNRALPKPTSILAVMVTPGRLGLGHDDGRGRRRRHRGGRGQTLLILGAAVDLARWGGRGWLGRRGGRLFCLSGLFHSSALDYPGCNRPHGLMGTIAVATPKRNRAQNFPARHPFAIPP